MTDSTFCTRREARGLRLVVKRRKGLYVFRQSQLAELAAAVTRSLAKTYERAAVPKRW